ncbi:MAG: flagellin lysine-N-methylase [Oscillospiraceae bacterium]|nr:flagellin lysine-N-methylase [Oscillospiraceae bacterium]
MEKIKVLVPDYYEKFFCIGSACEDNCCEADWKIFIDKSTYNLYRNIKEPKFKKELPERIKRIKGENASDKNYAQIILDDNGRCKFLENGICSIQAKYGFKTLSVTCLVFPRKQLKRLGGNIESALSVACPEVIRVGLFPSEKMTFKFIEIEKTHSKALASLPILHFDEKINILAKHALILRHCCIEIMQTRTISVADRLFAIGMMLKKLRELSDVGTFDEDSISRCAGQYVASAKSGQFDNLLASFADNEIIRADVKAILFNTAVSSVGKKRTFPHFIPCVEKHAKNLNKKPEELTHLEMSQMVDKAAAVFWSDFLEKRGHILENYFVNHIFGTVFPFSISLGIQHQILILAESYALFRILLCAPAGLDGEITDANVIKTITEVFRHTNHSSMIQNVTDNYILSGMDSLAHISFLLRD